MPIYDGTYLDIVNRLRDDEIISLNLIHLAANMLENYGAALEKIREYDGRQDAFIVCQNIAERTLNGE